MAFSIIRTSLKENQRIIIASTLILALGTVLGMIVPPGEGGSINDILAGLYPQISQLQPFTFSMALYILAKNSVAAATSYILGPLLIFPPLVLMLNGFLAGYVGALAADKYSLAFAIGILAPHGIFELPALIFACSAGLRLGLGVGRKVIRSLNHEQYSLTTDFMSSWGLLMLALMLLVIAAVMETYVSPWVGMQLIPH